MKLTSFKWIEIQGIFNMALASVEHLREDIEIPPLKKIYDNCSANERELLEWLYEKVVDKFEPKNVEEEQDTQ